VPTGVTVGGGGADTSAIHPPTHPPSLPPSLPHRNQRCPSSVYSRQHPATVTVGLSACYRGATLFILLYLFDLGQCVRQLPVVCPVYVICCMCVMLCYVLCFYACCSTNCPSGTNSKYELELELHTVYTLEKQSTAKMQTRRPDLSIHHHASMQRRAWSGYFLCGTRAETWQRRQNTPFHTCTRETPTFTITALNRLHSVCPGFCLLND